MIEAFVANLTTLLPFGYAFSAGMVTAVSPCGIAMLPVYASLYLGAEQAEFWAKSSLRRFARALTMSAMVTLGFVALFGIIGAILSIGGQFLLTFIPWLAILIGVALILLGIYLVTGGQVYTNLPTRLSNQLSNNGKLNIKGFIAFGITYGIAALSCTLPVFLAVVGSAMVMKGFILGLLQFVSFALGMGFVIATVTLGSVLFKETIHRWLHRLVPTVARLNGFLLILAGGYILYFWFKVGIS